jgi:hypothetical protein
LDKPVAFEFSAGTVTGVKLDLAGIILYIPEFLYGNYRSVKRSSQRLVASLQRGDSWDKTVETSNQLDTATTPGLLILHGPSPLVGGQLHFHCYVLHSLIREAFLDKRLPSDVEERVFQISLQHTWAFLGLLSEPNLGFLYPEARHKSFLAAALRYWKMLEAEGQRYSDGRDWGMDVWFAQSNLSYVLVHLGVPSKQVQTFDPRDGLDSLLRHVVPDDGRAS